MFSNNKRKLESSTNINTVKKGKGKGKEVTRLSPIRSQTNLSFESKAEGTTRIVAYNVKGIVSAVSKKLVSYLLAEDADIVVLTETMVNKEYQIVTAKNPFSPPLYPYRFWGWGTQSRVAGTAILSKIKPHNCVYGIPARIVSEEYQIETKGRIITLEFETIYLVGTYVPYGGKYDAETRKLDEFRVQRKKTWNAAFETYIHELDAIKPVIWCGDLNVARTAEDHHAWHSIRSRGILAAGLTDHEINAYIAQLESKVPGRKKLVDVWRELHPNTIQYTCFDDERPSRYTENKGSRIDNFVVGVPRFIFFECKLNPAYLMSTGV